MQKSKGRIILVDDDLAFHPTVGKVVDSLGFELIAVRSGEEGLQRIAKERPAAVILDGLLPGVRGEDVARRLRANHSSTELPIVFVSAFYRDLKSYRFLTNECGVDALLHKPLVPEQLRAVLGQLLAVGAEEEEAELDFDVETDFLQPESEEDAELLAQYLAGLKAKSAGMRAALDSLGGAGGAEALRSLRMDAHRLRGSGSSYGYPEITRLAGAVEDLIDRSGDELLGYGALRAKLDGLIQALLLKIDAAVGAAPIPVTRSRGWRPRVLLVDDGSPLARMAAALPPDDHLRFASDVEEAITAAIDDRPDVVMVGLGDEGVAVCARMNAAGIGPVVLMSRGDSLAERLMAIDSGAVGYLARPADVEGVFRIASVFATPRAGIHVVAAGGDRATLTSIAETLAPHGIAVEPAPEADDFIGKVERLAPALVVLDVDSWKMVGEKLLQVQRADLKFRQVPVVALSSTMERSRLLKAGAVAVLPNPFDPPELAAVVVSQLARRQSRESSRGRDPLTGLYDRAYLRQVCERSVALARREGRTLAIVGFEANLEELRAHGGTLTADELLASYASKLRGAFRDSDVVARIAPSRFATLLHSVRRLDVERLIHRQLEAFREMDLGLPGYVPSPYAALALFPETASSPDSLLESVDAQLNAALAEAAAPTLGVG